MSSSAETSSLIPVSDPLQGSSAGAETSSLSIADTIRVAFLAWLESLENRNHSRFTEERYFEYKAFIAFPNSKMPYDLRNNKASKCQWSNAKYDALAFYELVKRQLFRKASDKFQ